MRTVQGSIYDIFIAVLIFLVASISLIIAFYLAGQISASNTAIFGNVFGQVNAALNVMADGVILVYIVTSLIAIVAAYFVKSHPILAIVALMVLFVEVILANISVDVFQHIIQMSVFVNIGNTNIPLVVQTFKIVPLIVFIMGVILIFIQYGKSPATNASV